MDLLNGIEDISSGYVYKQTEVERDSEVEGVSDDEESNGEISVKFGQGTAEIAGADDVLSRLNKYKLRVMEGDQGTQNSERSEGGERGDEEGGSGGNSGEENDDFGGKNDDFDGENHYFDAENNDSDAENDLPSSQMVQLPQLGVDDAEIATQTQVLPKPATNDVTQRLNQPQSPNSSAATQPIGSGSSTQQIVSSTQQIPPELSPEERTAILIEKKKQQRLKKQSLEADISNTTLTDEENDYYETLPSKPKPKDLEDVDKFLHQKKREDFHIESKPAAKKFTKSDFISDFQSEFDQPDEEEVDGLKTPATSPPGDENVLNIKSSPLTEKHRSATNPIDTYQENLKHQFQNEIDLSDGDSDDNNSIPKVSKDFQLLLRKKFSFLKPKAKTNFMRKLFASNINQLQQLKESNPDFEALQEAEQDEELMGSLLEREMERNRAIRKREKLQERAKQALLNKDGDYQPENSDNESVADSVNDSVDESVNESVDESEDNNDDHEEDAKDSEDEDLVTKRRGKVIDSEESENSEDESQNFHRFSNAQVPQEEVNDDYMFGYKSTPNKGINIDNEVDGEDQSEISFVSNKELPSFRDITQVETQRTQPDDTQKDTTQKDTTQIDKTQIDKTQVDTTQILNEKTQKVNSASTQVLDIPPSQNRQILDDITPEAVNNGRKEIQKNVIPEESEEEEGDEELQNQIKAYEEKIRRKELQQKQRRRKFEAGGIKSIVDGEAEESEDEWQGLGGAEGEGDDEKANSEDERMIDNNFNIDLNDGEVRKKFMEQYQIKDQKELEKLVDDIKNHKLVKRAKNLDIELSDEEDELLMAYRKQRLEEQRAKVMENKKLQSMMTNNKTKAFFESIEENSIKIDLDDDEDNEEYNEDNDNNKESIESQPKPSNKIEHSFIQKKLSFLSNSVNDYDVQQKISDKQHDFNGSDDDIDINTFKMKSINNMNNKRSIEQVETDNDESNEEINHDINQENDSDEDLLPMNKKPSIIKSFQNQQDSKSNFAGVTVSKQYKAAGGSKASITYMSKKSKSNKLAKRSKHQKWISKLQSNSKTNGLFNSGGF